MNEITLNWIYLRKKDIIVLILSIWSGESVTFFYQLRLSVRTGREEKIQFIAFI